MCNLYRMTKAQSEVAKWFDSANEAAGSNIAAEIYPGYPGLVLESGCLRAMHWGFPLHLKGAKGQPLKPKPVNNARSDKLGSFFWKSSFEDRRCLIPLTAWAEAQGSKGAMTRTWLSKPCAELFAVAGVWRASDEWGDVYAMVMTEAAGPAAQVHSRMPVVLDQSDYSTWLSGEPANALALCQPRSRDLTIDHTDESWARGARLL